MSRSGRFFAIWGVCAALFVLLSTGNAGAVTIDPVATPVNVPTITVTGTMDSNDYNVTVTSTGGTVGSVSYPTTTTWSVQVSGLPEGTSTITATAAGEDPPNAQATITTPPVTTASPVGGTYATTQTVTLSCSDGAGAGCGNTYYTTDGSTPTIASSVYTTPLNITTSTTLQFFSVDAVGNNETVESQTYSFDTAGPIGTVAINSGAAATNSTAVTLTTTCSGDSGCSQMQFSNDNATWPGPVPYAATQPWNLASGDGNKTVYAQYQDGLGVWSASVSAGILLDTTPPVTTAAPAGGTYATAQMVTLSCSDGAGSGCATTYYTTDGSTPATTSSVYTAALAIATPTTLQYFSVDAVGNSEAVKSQSYTFDTAGPTGTVAIDGGAVATNSTTATLASTCSGTGGCSQMQFSNDNATWSAPAPYATTQTWTLAGGDGTKTVYARYQDGLGVWSAAVSAAILLDTTPPVTTAAPVGGTYATTQQVTLSCGDGAGSGCAKTYYTTDGSTPTTTSSVYSTPLTIATPTTLQYFSVDVAGNSETIKNQIYAFDTTGPTGTVVINSAAATTNSTAVTLTTTCSGVGGCSQMQFSNDNSTWSAAAPYAATPAWSLSSGDGTKIVYARYQDSLGVWSAPVSAGILLDTTPPVTTAAPAGGIYATAQTVALSCSDGSGSGCGKTYYTTDGSTPTTASSVYSTAINITTPATLQYFSVDVAGNSETVKSQSYTFDTTGPTGTVVINDGAVATNSASVTLTLTCSGDSGCSQMEFSNDNAAWSTPVAYATTQAWTLSSGNGSKTVYAKYKDGLGVWSAATSAGILLNTTPPTITKAASSTAAGYYGVQSKIDVSLTFSEPVYSSSGLTITLSSGATLTTGPLSLETFYDTSYEVVAGQNTAQLNVTAVTGTISDLANNQTQNPGVPAGANIGNMVQIAIETTAPVTTITSGPANPTNSKTGSITFTLNVAGATAQCAMDSASAFNTCSSPYVFDFSSQPDGNHTFSVRGIDQVGNVGAVKTYTWTIDTTPPVTTASPVGGTYNQSQTVTLSCSDGGSGCGKTYYTTDGSTPTTASSVYSTAINITATSTLKYFSVDVANNSETVKSQTYTIDTTGPTGTMVINGGAATTKSTAVTLTLTCTDNTGCTQMQFSNDNATWATAVTYATTQAWSLASGDGSKTVYVKYLDGVGNWSATISAGILLDTTPPVTTASPAGGTYATAQTVILSCSDGTGSGCGKTYYTTNGSTPTTASSVYSTALNITANTTLKYFSVDVAGNSEAVKKQTYTFDTTGPTGTVAINGGAAITNSASVNLTSTCSGDSGCSQMQFSNDNTTWAPAVTYAATQAWSLSSGDGSKTVYARYEDGLGVWSAAISAGILLDTTPPVTTASPLGGTYALAQTVILSCSDGTGSGCGKTYYTTDGSTPATTSSVYSTAINITTPTTLKYFSVDVAGNSETVKSQSYTFDTTGPTGTVVIDAGAVATNSASVNLTLTCSGDSGCSQMQFSNDNSMWSTAVTYAATQPWSLASGDGSKTVYAKYKDGLGVWSAAISTGILLDTTPPVTTASPAGGTYAAAQTVTLTCSDGTGSGCGKTYYTTDGSTPTTASSVYSAAITISTATTLQYFSVDAVGNSEAVKSQSYTFDTAGPTGTVVINSGAVATNATAVTLTTTCSGDSGCSQMEFSNDNATWSSAVPYATTQTWTLASGDGTKTVYARYQDGLGVWSAAVSAAILLDTTPPVTTAAPVGGTYAAAQQVTLSCSDGSGSGCAKTYYTTNGNTPTTASSVYSAAITISTATTLQYFSVDAVGNSEAVKSQSYTFDTAGPTGTVVINSGAVATNSTTATLALTCSGTGGCSQMQFSNDNATWSAPVPYAATQTWSLTSGDGAKTVYARYQDGLGVWSAAISAPILLDTTPPVTTAAPAGGIYAAAQAVVLTCSDGSGSGCAKTYYTTNGNTPTAASSVYSAAITISTATNLQYFSVDAVGNSEAVKSQSYTFDTAGPTGTVVINSGAVATNATAVTLTTTCSGDSGCSQMQFSNDNATWSAAVTYAATQAWSLSSGAGSKIVYARFRDGLGVWSAPVSAGILYDTTPPVVSAGPSQATNAPVTVAGTASDTLASPMTYAWSQLPSTAGPGTVTFSAPTSLTTQVTASQNGVYTLQLAATDSAGNVSTSTTTLTWDTTSPVVSAGLPNLATNTPITITGSASDAMGLPMTYAWSQVPTAAGPGTVTFSTPTSPTTQVTASQNGVYTLQLTATDSAGNVSTSPPMTLTWDTTSPVVSAGPNRATNTPITITGSASDAMGLPMTYAWSLVSAPLGGTVVFGTPTALATTISASMNGPYVVQLTVLDTAGNSASSNLTFTWSTTPPTVSAGTGPVANSQFTQVGQVTDNVPVTTVAWSQVSGPGTVSFGSPQATTTTISASQDGVYVVSLTATDAAGNSASSTMSFTWDTASLTISAGPDRTTNTAISQTGAVSDLTSVTLAWSMSSGPGTLTFSAPNALTTTITASQDGVYVVTLAATDTAGNVKSSTMNLVWAATPPVVSAGPNQIVNATVTQTGTATSDVAALAMTYLWSKISGPGTLTFGAATTLTTSITASANGVYVVGLTATDAAGNVSTSTMNLTWDTVGPVVSAGPNQVVNGPVTLTATATSGAGLAMTYLWSQTSGAGTLTFSAASALTTTITASTDGVYVVNLAVRDAAGNVSTSTMNLTWDTQQPTVSAGPSSAQNAQFTQTGFASGVTGLTYLWSQQSGPGQITFGTATALATTVSANQQGVYDIRLTATDAAGNVNYSDATITWDTTPPVLRLSTLPNGSYTANNTLPINGVATDSLSGIGRVTVNGAAMTLDASGAFSTTITLLSGANIISTIATDLAGNQTFDTRTVIYDPTVPAITITAPTSTDYYTNQSSMTLTGTVDQESAISIQITGPGPTQQIANVPVAGNLFSQQLTGLTPGLNTVNVIATTPAGVVATQSVSVTYETTVPVLTVDSPATDIRPATNSITVSGTASDAMTDVAVTMTVNEIYPVQVSTTPYTPVVAADGTYSQVVTLSAKGFYLLTVQATNQAGGQTTVTRRVIYANPTGDVNGDGTVDITDALLALQVGVGLMPMQDRYLTYGDVGPLVNGAPDPDWKINISDAIVILQIIVGSVTLQQ